MAAGLPAPDRNYKTKNELALPEPNRSSTVHAMRAIVPLSSA
jgi:hypothetical protein